MAPERPTVVRRQLGRRLKRHREAVGKTHDDVKEADIASRSKMWKIESGRIPVRGGDILSLARLYGLDGHETDELLALAAASKDTGFLESHTGVPEWVGMYADLEAVASELWLYNSEIVPGIIQCQNYARGVMAAETSFSEDDIQQRLRFRSARQDAFFERAQPGKVQLVLTAGAMNLRVDSQTVMEEQLAYMRALIKRERLDVRVLKATDGVHTSMRGPFVVLLYEDDLDPNLGYVESVVGARYFDRPEHVEAFKRAFERVRAQSVDLEEYLQ
jgi:hypothetical protein